MVRLSVGWSVGRLVAVVVAVAVVDGWLLAVAVVVAVFAVVAVVVAVAVVDVVDVVVAAAVVSNAASTSWGRLISQLVGWIG